MHIYEVETYWYDESEMDNAYIQDYVTHEKLFSQEEFQKICEESSKKEAFEITKYLIENHGFKRFEIAQRYSAEEDC